MLMPSCVVLLALGQSPAATDQAPHPEKLWLQTLGWHLLESCAKTPLPRSESHEMLSGILTGSLMDMGMGDGWFKPSRRRHDWTWLRRQQGAKNLDRIGRADFKGPPDLFARLDRDGDGAITAQDLDWTDQSLFLKQAAQVRPWFYRLDRDANGRISRQEWLDFFEKAAAGKDHLTPEDLRKALMPPLIAQGTSKGPSKPNPAMTKVFLQGLFQGELGSPFEGPRPGDLAPDFTLKRFDGSATMTLSKLLGEKPVVLIFGSFT